MPVEPPPCAWSLPDVETADESGVVGVGGDLSPGTLLHAYRSGLFPMHVDRGRTLGVVVARSPGHPPARRAAGLAVAAPVVRRLRDPGRHRLRRGGRQLRRPEASARLDHRRHPPGLPSAARAGLGPQRGGVEPRRRHARRRPLRRVGRRAVRRGVDVPPPTATPPRSPSSAWSTCYRRRRRPAPRRAVDHRPPAVARRRGHRPERLHRQAQRCAAPADAACLHLTVRRVTGRSRSCLSALLALAAAVAVALAGLLGRGRRRSGRRLGGLVVVVDLRLTLVVGLVLGRRARSRSRRRLGLLGDPASAASSSCAGLAFLPSWPWATARTHWPWFFAPPRSVLQDLAASDTSCRGSPGGLRPLRRGCRSGCRPRRRRRRDGLVALVVALDLVVSSSSPSSSSSAPASVSTVTSSSPQSSSAPASAAATGSTVPSSAATSSTRCASVASSSPPGTWSSSSCSRRPSPARRPRRPRTRPPRRGRGWRHRSRSRR